MSCPPSALSAIPAGPCSPGPGRSLARLLLPLSRVLSFLSPRYSHCSRAEIIGFPALGAVLGSISIKKRKKKKRRKGDLRNSEMKIFRSPWDRKKLSLSSGLGCSNWEQSFSWGFSWSHCLAQNGSLPKPGSRRIPAKVNKVKRKALYAGNSGNYRDGSNSSKLKVILPE